MSWLWSQPLVVTQEDFLALVLFKFILVVFSVPNVTHFYLNYITW